MIAFSFCFCRVRYSWEMAQFPHGVRAPQKGTCIMYFASQASSPFLGQKEPAIRKSPKMAPLMAGGMGLGVCVKMGGVGRGLRCPFSALFILLVREVGKAGMNPGFGPLKGSHKFVFFWRGSFQRIPYFSPRSQANRCSLSTFGASEVAVVMDGPGRLFALISGP